MNHQWKMVPVEPTEEMEAAAVDDYEQSGGTYRKSGYAAMLDAAPTPPASIPVRERYEYALARLGLTDSPPLRVIFWDALDALEWDTATDRYVTPHPTPPASAQDDAKDDGLAEAQRLAQALFQRHFARDDDYVSGRVKWEVLGDLPGVISQIDNMVSGLVQPAAPAAGDARDEPAPEWAACESRRPWVTNGLKASAQELRDKEKRCRTAFNKDFMGVPSRYVADAYGEAAAVFEAKLAAIAASQQQEG